MTADKFSATWVSHTSISDFLECPRLYYLKNIYKDPKTGHKVQVMSAPLALGQAVHEVLEALSVIPTDRRFSEPLLDRFDIAWEKVSGKKGGFWNKDIEHRYKERGKAMLRRVEQNPGVLQNKAIKINMDLPWFWLSEEENIILCGKIDWLEYNEEADTVHIIDFKTGKHKESGKSLQLPIYTLLVHECQHREVSGISYWYLETDDALEAKEMPDLEDSRREILDIARRIKIARSLEKFDCPNGTSGCSACRDYEKILSGDAEYVGVGGYKHDIYIIPQQGDLVDKEDSRIL